MSLRTCAKHGPYIADTSTDFGETWCPECGPRAVSADTRRDEREELEQLERDADDLRREQEAEERWTEVVEPDERRMP